MCPLDKWRSALDFSLATRELPVLDFFCEGYPSAPVVLIKPLAYFPRCARARAVLCKLVVIRSGGVLAGSCQDADRVYGVLPGQTFLALSDNESIKSSARLIVGVEQRKSGH